MRYFSLPEGGAEALAQKLLESQQVEAVLVPLRSREGRIQGPALVRDPRHLEGLDLFTPLSWHNLARTLAQVARPDGNGRILAFLRPCEIRTMVELQKLQQIDPERVVVCGLDCLGMAAASERDTLSERSPEQWAEVLSDGEIPEEASGFFRELCGVCPDVEAPHADLRILTVGAEAPLVAAEGSWAEELEKAGLEEVEAPSGRDSLVSGLRKARAEALEALKEEAERDLIPLTAMMERFSTCIRCGNCRSMCPACFCPQCVFETPDFRHEPETYLGWADRKGELDLPAEMALFHLTRLNHMVLSCVGCGHCSSACPQGLPVATLFYTLGQRTGRLFEYEAGGDPDQEHPFQTYEEEELEPR